MSLRREAAGGRTRTPEHDAPARNRQLDMADLFSGGTGSRGTSTDTLTRTSWWLDVKEDRLRLHFYLWMEQNLTHEVPVITFLVPYKILQTEQDMIIMIK